MQLAGLNLTIGLDLTVRLYGSIAQANDAVGVFKQPHVMRGENKGEPKSAIEAVHQIDELRGVVGVEVGGWFVGQHQSRTMHDCASDGHALTLAAGEQVRAMTGSRG